MWAIYLGIGHYFSVLHAPCCGMIEILGCSINPLSWVSLSSMTYVGTSGLLTMSSRHNLPLMVRMRNVRCMLGGNPPPCNVHKVNVDGSHYPDHGTTTCGGFVRNLDGNFIKGFYCNIGSSNLFWAEMWALLLGVRLAQSMALPEVIFELDSISIVQAVKSGYSRPLLYNRSWMKSSPC